MNRIVTIILSCCLLILNSCAVKIMSPLKAALPVPSILLPSTHPLVGKWLSDGCIDFGGGNYFKIFAELNDSEEYVALLAYGADSTCAGIYSMSDINGNAVTVPPLTFTFSVPFTTITNAPAGYFGATLIMVGSGTPIHQLFYQFSSTQFSDAAEGTVVDPGTDWSSWSAETKFVSFAANPMTGVSFSKVTALP